MPEENIPPVTPTVEVPEAPTEVKENENKEAIASTEAAV